MEHTVHRHVAANVTVGSWRDEVVFNDLDFADDIVYLLK